MAERGNDFEAIGLEKGECNSKIHSVVNEPCRPWVFVLRPGNTADCAMAEGSVRLIAGVKPLLADKSYDTDVLCAFLKKRRIRPVIPGKSNRKKKIRHDKNVCKGCKVVER